MEWPLRFISLYIYFSIFLYISLFIYIYLYISIYISVYLFISISISLYISRNTEKRSPGLTDRLRARKNVATARLIKRISTPLLGSPYQVCRNKVFFFKFVRAILNRPFFRSFKKKRSFLFLCKRSISFVFFLKDILTYDIISFVQKKT